MSYQDITDDQIMATLAEVVGEAPETVYASPEHMIDAATTNGNTNGETCFYVHRPAPGTDGDAQPGCLVGQVLNRLGVPLDELAEHEARGADYVMTQLGIGTDQTRDALCNAQSIQDSGKPWSDALIRAQALMSA